MRKRVKLRLTNFSPQQLQNVVNIYRTEGNYRMSLLGGSHVQCEMTVKYLVDIQGRQLDIGAIVQLSTMLCSWEIILKV